MNLKGRVPVEPLDDDRMTNIERRIVAGAAEATPSASPRAARLFGWGVAVAMAAAIAIGAGFTGWMLRDRGSRAVTATIATAEPVHMHTTNERSVLDIGDARIASDPLTDFTVTRPAGGVLVTMTRGKVELTVGKRGDRPPLVVAAGDTRVVVVGTQFSVDYGDGTNGVDVRVTEGVVRVERLAQEVRVAAGQAWTTKRGVVALGELPLPPELQATGDAPQVGDHIEIDTTTPDVLKDRTSSVPDTKLPMPGTRSAATRPTKPEVHRDPLPGGGAGSSAAMDLRKAVRDVDVLPPLELPGVEPKDAVASYRDIAARTKGEQASLAFYSIAWMQHLKLGRSGDALQTLDQYLRRFVGGKEYAAALWLRVRILCSKTVDERCRQAAYAHLHQATGTPAAKVSEALTLAPR